MNKTIQRQTICEELCKLTSHPTADELYDIVKKRMPQISLGTVYRNLEQLAECGVEKAFVRVTDRGALDCVIKARVETAVRRGEAEK